MGMDPLLDDETYEVTVVLEGPVKKKGLRNFRKALDDFIDDCEKKDSGVQDPNDPSKNKLKVRESRAGLRKKT
jgi:hypothetical protein